MSSGRMAQEVGRLATGDSIEDTASCHAALLHLLPNEKPLRGETSVPVTTMRVPSLHNDMHAARIVSERSSEKVISLREQKLLLYNELYLASLVCLRVHLYPLPVDK